MTKTPREPTPDPPRQPEIDLEPGTVGAVSEETDTLLAEGQRANNRLRRFAYVTLSIVMVGILIMVGLGIGNTLSLKHEYSRVKQNAQDNHTLLERSATGSVKAEKLFEQAITLLTKLHADSAKDRAADTQLIINILKANHFKIPPGMEKPPTPSS